MIANTRTSRNTPTAAGSAETIGTTAFQPPNRYFAHMTCL